MARSKQTEETRMLDPMHSIHTASAGVQGHPTPGANGAPPADDRPSCEVIVWENGKDRRKRGRWPLPDDADLGDQMHALGYEPEPWFRLGSSDAFDSLTLEVYCARDSEELQYPYIVGLTSFVRTYDWVVCPTLADLFDLCNRAKDLIRLSTETEQRVMAQQEQDDADRLRRKYGGAA